MKFECDKCQTRYNISDDKVKGKVLKIRCKTCQNIIEVRESSAITTDDDISSAFEQAKSNAEWFVAIKGEQHGPMSKKEVENFFTEGKIHSRSYCWHENLSEWTRLKELPDFQAVINLSKNDEDASLSASRPILPEAASRAQPKASKATTPFSDPFAAAAKKGVSLPPVAEGAPRESTRVFIMNAGLHNRDKKHKAYALAAILFTVGMITLGYLDYTGIYRIPLLSAVAQKVAEKMGDEEAIKMYQLREIEDLTGIVSEEEQLAMRCKLTGEKCPEPTKVVRKRKRSKSNNTDDGLDISGAFQTGDGTGSELERRKGSIADIEMTGDPLKDLNRQRLGIGRDRGPKTPIINTKLKGQEIDVAGGSLTGPQISKVIKANKNSVARCIQKSSKNGSDVHGKHFLKLIIKPNGRVKHAKITDGVTAVTPLGECLAKAGKKWKFPPGNIETEVDVPLILGTKY